MAFITSSVDLLYLVKTSWCCWIIFIKENLMFLIRPFCFNIQSSIVLVALKILSNSGPVLPYNILLGILEQ